MLYGEKKTLSVAPVIFLYMSTANAELPSDKEAISALETLGAVSRSALYFSRVIAPCVCVETPVLLVEEGLFGLKAFLAQSEKSAIIDARKTMARRGNSFIRTSHRNV